MPATALAGRNGLALLFLTLCLALSGCCTRQRLDDFSRFEGTANRPSGLCGIFSGYGTMDEPDRWAALYSPVGVAEYGDLLCGHLDLEDYSSCVNRVWGSYREELRRTPEPGRSTSGPFAVVVNDQLLLGSYWSDPFSASFSVSSDRVACRGSYSALHGDRRPVFDVSCDNGMRGRAEIVRDRSGRGGIGRVYMEDGEVGGVVFGPAVVSGLSEWR
jgi:hypothetical protein